MTTNSNGGFKDLPHASYFSGNACNIDVNLYPSYFLEFGIITPLRSVSSKFKRPPLKNVLHDFATELYRMSLYLYTFFPLSELYDIKLEIPKSGFNLISPEILSQSNTF